MGGATEWARSVFGREPKREQKMVSPNVSVKKNRAGVLLPSSENVIKEATRMVRSQFLAWAAGQPDRDKSLDSLIADDVVPALSPQAIPLPGNPDFVVFFPSKKGALLEEIADTFGGVVGLSGVDVTVSYLGQPMWACKHVAEQILSGVRNAMPAQDRVGDLAKVAVASRGDHIMVSLEPHRDRRALYRIPAFGQERDGIISFAEQLEGAYRLPVQLDKSGCLITASKG